MLCALLIAALGGEPALADEPPAPQPLLSGVVVDRKGRPVAEVQIDNLAVTTTGTSARLDVKTDSEGRFAVPWPLGRTGEAAPSVVAAWLQARTEDGRSSAALLQTELTAEQRLVLREAAVLELTLAGAGDPVTAFVHATVQREGLTNNALLLHSGSAAVERGLLSVDRVFPGRLQAYVEVDAKSGYISADLVAGETTAATVVVGAPGELGLTLPYGGRGATCLLSPGTTYDARRGLPTVARCTDLEPPNTRYDDLVPGEQVLTIRQHDGTSTLRRLRVLPGLWCGFRVQTLEATATTPLVGVQLPIDGREARVEGVVEGSPAAAAGLLVGDRVVSVNGDEVRSGLSATLAIRAVDPDTRVRLRIQRDSGFLTLDLRKPPVAPIPLLEPKWCGPGPLHRAVPEERAIPSVRP